MEAFDKYCEVRPKIVVSHDCPQSVMMQLFRYPEKSQTRTMLEMMFQEHQPELWIFGHHHKSKDEIINGGTRFICLSELETFEIKKGYPDRIFVNWGNSIRYWYFPNTRTFERVYPDYEFN